MDFWAWSSEAKAEAEAGAEVGVDVEFKGAQTERSSRELRLHKQAAPQAPNEP